MAHVAMQHPAGAIRLPVLDYDTREITLVDLRTDDLDGDLARRAADVAAAFCWLHPTKAPEHGQMRLEGVELSRRQRDKLSAHLGPAPLMWRNADNQVTPQNLVASYERYLAAYREAAADLIAADAARQVPEEVQRAEKARFETEMRAWAERHGSARLKSAIAEGGAANAVYRTERTEVELPGMWVDGPGDIYHEPRRSPSNSARAALHAVQAYLEERSIDASGVDLVWVKTLPAAVVDDDSVTELDPREQLSVSRSSRIGEWEDRGPGGWYGVEAVRVHGWLGRYDAFGFVLPDSADGLVGDVPLDALKCTITGSYPAGGVTPPGPDALWEFDELHMAYAGTPDGTVWGYMSPGHHEQAEPDTTWHVTRFEDGEWAGDAELTFRQTLAHLPRTDEARRFFQRAVRATCEAIVLNAVHELGAYRANPLYEDGLGLASEELDRANRMQEMLDSVFPDRLPEPAPICLPVKTVGPEDVVDWLGEDPCWKLREEHMETVETNGNRIEVIADDGARVWFVPPGHDGVNGAVNPGSVDDRTWWWRAQMRRNDALQEAQLPAQMVVGLVPERWETWVIEQTRIAVSDARMSQEAAADEDDAEWGRECKEAEARLDAELKLARAAETINVAARRSAATVFAARAHSRRSLHWSVVDDHADGQDPDGFRERRRLVAPSVDDPSWRIERRDAEQDPDASEPRIVHHVGVDELIEAVPEMAEWIRDMTRLAVEEIRGQLRSLAETPVDANVAARLRRLAMSMEDLLA